MKSSGLGLSMINVGVTMTNAEHAELMRLWREKYVGGGAAHRVVVLPSGVTFTPLPARSCSYCRAEVVTARSTCANCGAPVN